MSRASSKLRGSPGARMLKAFCLVALFAGISAIQFGDIYNSGLYFDGEKVPDGSGAPAVDTVPLTAPSYTANGWVFKVTYYPSNPAPKVKKLYLKVVDKDNTITATDIKPNCDRDEFLSCDFTKASLGVDATNNPNHDYYVWTLKPPEASTALEANDNVKQPTFDASSLTGLSMVITPKTTTSAGATCGTDADGAPCGQDVTWTITEKALQIMGVDMSAGADTGAYDFGLIAGYYEEADPELHKENANSAAAGNALIDFAYHQELFKVSYSDRAIYVVCDKNQEASFLRFAYARIHEVPDVDGNCQKEYYASVSFAVTKGLEAYVATTDGPYITQLVDLSSLKATIGTTTVIDGTSPACAAVKSDSLLRCQAKSATGGVFAQTCAPPTADGDRFCNGEYDKNTGYATFYYPLGNNDPTNKKVDLEFVIQLKDSTAADSNVIFESVGLTVDTTNGLIEWCSGPGPSGVVELAGQVKVKSYTGINENGFASEISGKTGTSTAQSALDGLITLHIQSEEPGFHPVLEELYTVHQYISQPSSGFDACAAIANGGYTVTVDGSGGANIDFSPDVGGYSIKDVCTEKKFTDWNVNHCYLRTESTTGGTTNVFDVIQESDAGTWLSNLATEMAGGADYANAAMTETTTRLGDSYKSAILGEPNVDLAANDKIFWINPGEYWSTPTTISQKISLSSSVCVLALVRLDIDGGQNLVNRRGSKRRLLAATVKPDAPTNTGIASVRYDVTPAGFAASIMNVDPDYVTSWNLDMEVSTSDACLPTEELVAKARSQLNAAVQSAGTSVRTVEVVSLTLNKNGVQCRRSKHQRTLLAGQTPSVSVSALIIFDDSSTAKPALDVNALESVSGISKVVQTQSSAVVSVVPKEVSATAEASDDGSSSSNVPVIAGAVAGAVAVVGIAALVMWRRGTGSGSRDLEVAQVPPALALDNKLADLRTELDAGPGPHP